MSIFDILFRKNNFPDECNDGTVKIVGNKIICKGNHGIQSCEVNIDDIQYAYVIVNVNKQSFLFLFDSHQNSIPTIYKGVKTADDVARVAKAYDAVLVGETLMRAEKAKEVAQALQVSRV